jgi:DNA-binding NtrC family response regulator
LEIRSLIQRAAAANVTVPITGQSGVGKERVARQIHEQSNRQSAAFVPLNCAAIPETLLEAELFGHEQGAFTDARQRRQGAFERASGGTLFMDEIGDLSPTAQPKLLRALESGEVQRVGGQSARPVDLRTVAATNQDLGAMCADGRFRSDLYYRLRVLSIHVPPLCERIEDVPILVDAYLNRLAARTNRRASVVTPIAMEYLCSYPWPGNVRELNAALERAVALNPDSDRLDLAAFELEPPDLPASLNGLLDLEWRSAREGFEAAYAKRLLRRHSGNVLKASRTAGLAARSLYKMMHRLGLRSAQLSL